ncbi:MAG: VanZ family protein [Clostridia bacterium]|nr:VanZ family protein [Clostridia bacterium]MBP3681628.1 VanZ family protein [Clostridia bacterium]
MENIKDKEQYKKEIIKCINIILVLIWMIIVFWFSAQIGESSSNISGNTIRRIITFLNNNISALELEKIVEFLQPIVRKLAHFTMYTIGGFLIYNLFKAINNTEKKKIIYSFIFGVIYATTDEIHQLFVQGRSGSIIDVGIDSLGVISGICIYIILRKFINRILKYKK